MKKLISVLLLLALTLSTLPAFAFGLGDLGDMVDSVLGGDDDDAAETDLDEMSFRDAVDAYEAFYMKYIDVLVKYNNDPEDLSILTDYMELIEQAEDIDDFIDDIDEDELSAEDYAYFLEANARVLARMAEVGLSD